MYIKYLIFQNVSRPEIWLQVKIDFPTENQTLQTHNDLLLSIEP